MSLPGGVWGRPKLWPRLHFPRGISVPRGLAFKPDCLAALQTLLFLCAELLCCKHNYTVGGHC
eukprot:989308-Pelagomonas_calceolata.AAC.1